MDGDGLGDEGNAVWRGGRIARTRVREKIFNFEIEGGENLIERGETETAFSVKKIGDMGRIEACLPREQCSGQRAALDAPQQFAPELLVELRDIHCGNFS